MKLKYLFLSMLCVTATVSSAHADRILTRCPKYIVDGARGTYQSFGSALPGKLCSNNLRALKRKGFIPEGPSTPTTTTPGPIQNPILDTERVFTGRGEVSIPTAFRVSTVARVVTLRTSNCLRSGEYVPVMLRLTNHSGGNEYIHAWAGGEATSLTIFDPGTYGMYLSYTYENACDVQIQVQ